MKNKTKKFTFFIFIVISIFSRIDAINYKTENIKLKDELEYYRSTEKFKFQLKSYLQEDDYPKIEQIHFKDKDGFVWMTKENPISENKEFIRFDGKSFENITQDFVVPNSDTLFTITSDNKGNIFFLGKKGYAKWNKYGYDYRNFPVGEKLHYIYSNHKGKIYFLGNSGYVVYAGDEFHYKKLFTYGPWVVNIPVNLKIELVDSKDRIWISWGNNFVEKKHMKKYYNKYVGYIFRDKFHLVYEKQLSEIPFINLKIIEDSIGDIYIYNAGFIYKFNANKLSDFTKTLTVKRVIDYCIDNNDNLWIIGEDKDFNNPLFCINENYRNNGYLVQTFRKLQYKKGRQLN